MTRGGWSDGRARLSIEPETEPGAEPQRLPPLTLPLEIATSYRARTRGLLGRTALEGALLLTPANSIHTFGMRIPIDVAYLDRNLTVLTVRTMPPNRLGLPRPRARHVLEAEAGTMERWGLRRGTMVRVEEERPT